MERAITQITTATITPTCSVVGIIFTINNNGETSLSICILDIIDLSETQAKDSKVLWRISETLICLVMNHMWL